MDDEIHTSLQVAGDSDAVIVLDARRYGLSDKRQIRYSYWHLRDGKYSLISARYEDTLYAVTKDQHKAWSRMHIIRRQMYSRSLRVTLRDIMQTWRYERTLRQVDAETLK